MSNSALSYYVENEMVFEFKPVGGQLGGSGATTINSMDNDANHDMKSEMQEHISTREALEPGGQVEPENSVVNTVKNNFENGMSYIRHGVSRAGTVMFKNLETLGDQASIFQKALSTDNSDQPNEKEIFSQICTQYSRKEKEKIDELFEEGLQEFMNKNTGFDEDDLRAELTKIKIEFARECQKIGP